MPRPGTKLAEKVLAGVMNDFGVTLAELRSKSRSEDICLAKQAFLDRSGELKIPVIVMADVLGLTPCTITYRGNAAMRERRNLSKRRLRAANRAIAKARVSSLPSFGTNHFVIGSAYPRGIYTPFIAEAGR
jgi:hypothetical protein